MKAKVGKMEVSAEKVTEEAPTSLRVKFTNTPKEKRIKTSVQAAEMQLFTFQVAMALRDELKDKNGNIQFTRDEDGKINEAPAIAQVLRAWEIAADRHRIQQGKPLPGSLKPTNTKPRKRPQAGDTPLQVVSIEPKPLSSIVSG